jgi:tRNA-specific 2-thiouridylase
MTPNPCIDCNKYMKFDKLFERAIELSCDHVATGHYARVEKIGNKFVLKKALDDTKDQSYVLYSLTQEQLAHVLFPLGNLKKTETRIIAEENGFINANKPDSQDICFVPNGDYASIIELLTGVKSKPGNFVDTNGKVLGQHKGIINYTIGQHKGLGLSLPFSMYVKKIDPDRNEVVLCAENELYDYDVNVGEFNWISGEVPDKPIRCKAKIRYRQQEKEATVTSTGKSKVHIHFDEPQRAITPGQSAVLYDGDIVLGGGTIM